MTKDELIESLKNYPDDTKVQICIKYPPPRFGQTFDVKRISQGIDFLDDCMSILIVAVDEESEIPEYIKKDMEQRHKSNPNPWGLKIKQKESK